MGGRRRRYWRSTGGSSGSERRHPILRPRLPGGIGVLVTPHPLPQT